MTYDWGDCMVLKCRGPSGKYGFFGWLATVGSDIALAIVFEILLSICGGLAELVVSFRNYEDLQVDPI